MNITRIALQEDLNENYDLHRLENEWSTEAPIQEATGFGLDILGLKTQAYANFMRNKGLTDQEILKACTFSKASLEAMLENASGLRIYLAADTKLDENNEEYIDIYPIVVPVGDAFEDMLDPAPGKLNFIMDIASKCPPPKGACTEQFFKISPK